MLEEYVRVFLDFIAQSQSSHSHHEVITRTTILPIIPLYDNSQDEKSDTAARHGVSQAHGGRLTPLWYRNHCPWDLTLSACVLFYRHR
jgi:hypothetical protein